MAKFRSGDIVGEAMQVDVLDDHLRDFLSEARWEVLSDDGELQISVWTNVGPMWPISGDWLISFGGPEVFVLSNDLFTSMYEAVTE